MERLNTIFLGVIAAVMVGAAVVWWLSQPSAAELEAERSREWLDEYLERN